MKKQFDRLEQQKIKRLAKEYRAKGYNVQVNPEHDILPPFFGLYRPDLLVTRGDEHIVVEVKSRATLGSSDQLAGVAKILESRPGWRFELVVTNPSDTTKEEISEVRPELAQTRLAEAQRMLVGGQNEGALLLGWAAAEGALRALAAREDISLKQQQPNYMIKILFSRGLLNNREFELLDGFRLARTQIAHGFDGPAISSAKIRDCLELTSHILQRAQGRGATTD